MPDLNEHMDELMRKAAEEYPLRIAGNDWEKISTQIHPSNDRRRPWFWIFFPAAIGIAFLTWFLLRNTDAIPGQIAENKPASHGNITPPSIAGQTSSVSILAAEPESNQHDQANAGIIQTPPGHNSMGFSNNNDQVNLDGKEPGNEISPRTRTKKTTGNKSMMAIIPAGFSEPPGEVKTKTEQSFSNLGKDEPVNRENGNGDTGNEVKEEESQKATPQLPVVIKYIPVGNTINEEEPRKKKNSLRFYAGLTGGLDVSSVKLQGFDRTGKNFGIITGIELNDHWAIETGVAVNRKYYSTDGKYFKGTYPLPYYATIESATGDCDMLDIPITARYTFNPSKKIRYTVNAGFSSYLMQEESYIYHVNHNGNRYPKNMEYSNTKFTPFAVFTSGVGISLAIKKFSLGAEPYFRLPLQKMGTGKLPLQSAGINLRIIRGF